MEAPALKIAPEDVAVAVLENVAEAAQEHVADAIQHVGINVETLVRKIVKQCARLIALLPVDTLAQHM